MQVFKTAMRTSLRHPVYLTVYAVFLSLLGVFIAQSIPFSSNDAFSPHDTAYAVIDRDGSDLSRGLAAFLETQGNPVEVADDELAMQDAVAKGKTAFLIIIPQNYEQDFFETARNGDDAPIAETVYSFYSSEGGLMNQSVEEYLGLARAQAAIGAESSAATVVEKTAATMKETAQVDSVQSGTTAPESARFVFYLQWGTYTLFASIVVCASIGFSALNRTDVRRRNLTSPQSSLSLGAQSFAAGLVIAVLVWTWTIVLGVAVFHDAVAQISGIGLALMLTASFSFVFVPLSLAYLLGQIRIGEGAGNAIGNILGMAISFLGGAWVSYDLMCPSVQIIAQFFPGIWYTNALQEASGFVSPTLEELAPYLSDVGVLLLFAVTIFATGLVVGRARMRSSEAGGNAAAATS